VLSRNPPATTGKGLARSKVASTSACRIDSRNSDSTKETTEPIQNVAQVNVPKLDVENADMLAWAH